MLSIFKVSISTSAPEAVNRNNCRCSGNELILGATTFNLEDFENIYVVGAGIATAPIAAGAIADNLSLKRAEKQHINIDDYLANNDSYHFFQNLNNLVQIGPINTNVMDIRLLLPGSSP